MACLKPDSDTELVIPYDCEDKFCSFNVSEFENSVVKLISITRIDTLGRRVRQELQSLMKIILEINRESSNAKILTVFQILLQILLTMTSMMRMTPH